MPTIVDAVSCHALSPLFNHGGLDSLGSKFSGNGTAAISSAQIGLCTPSLVELVMVEVMALSILIWISGLVPAVTFFDHVILLFKTKVKDFKVTRTPSFLHMYSLFELTTFFNVKGQN